MERRGATTAVTFAIPPPDRSCLVTEKVICYGNIVEAIIDTGAGISVISPGFARKLDGGKINKWGGHPLLLADGSVTTPEGSIELEVVVGGKPLSCTAAILNLNGFDLLLGNNALRQLKTVTISYDREGGATLLNGNDFELIEEKEQKVVLVNKESRSIPAFSMIVLAVELRERGGVGQGTEGMMVEPTPKLLANKGISVGRFLLPDKPTEEVDLVQITNFSSSTQWVGKGTVLGQVVPVEVMRREDEGVSRERNFDFLSSINKELPNNDRAAVAELLKKYSECFARSKLELGRSKLVKHRIDTGNHPPIHQHPYKTAFKEREIIQEQIRDMLEAGVIEESNSPWASPVVMVRKKDGSWRFCVDYRRLNSVTVKDVYPLPRIDDALSCMEGAKYFTIMDMQAGYWQVVLDKEGRIKTAFVITDGLFHFKVMPFGLTNSPATFQRMVDVMFAGLKWNTCLVYLDDVVVFSKTIPEHLARLEAVLERVLVSGLKLKLSKCSFLQTTLNVLGYVVSGEGLSPDPAKVSAVQDFPTPKCLKDVQSFVGLCSYYRKFIKDFAGLARPLTNLTKKNSPFIWSVDQQAGFEALKQALVSPPVLGHPNYNLPMEIHCDACGYGVGAVLVQQQEEGERVLSYASRLLGPAESNYSISEKECLALVWAVQKFRSYVWGNRIRIVTDHHALCWLMKKRDLAGRLARWSLQLQDHDMEIVHRSGRLHSDADALSRLSRRRTGNSDALCYSRST